MARRKKRIRPKRDGRQHASVFFSHSPKRKKKLGMSVEIVPTGYGAGDMAFMACVTINKASGGACANGRNPRKAVSGAMALAAKMLNRRKGAFHGI